MIMKTVTELQFKMMNAIATSEFNGVDGNVDSLSDHTDTRTWLNMIVETPEQKGVLTSLQNKGLVETFLDSNPSDNLVALTEEGFELFKQLNK